MPALSRRSFLTLAAAVSTSLKSFAATASSGLVHVYFGTDTDTEDKSSQGVYEALWNPSTGKFGTLRLAAKEIRPTFLAQTGSFLYILDEINEPDGTLESYTRSADGLLRKMNAVSTKGVGPAFISVHPSGKAAYVANYAGGSMTSFRILPNGHLSEAVAHFQYTGHGPNPDRQKAPHAHSAVVSPDGNFLLVNDLGLDQIHIYRIDPVNPADISLNAPGAWQGLTGAGSRHLAFAPNGTIVYNLNEMASTIDVLQWDARAGTLTTIGGPISTLPADFKGVSTSSEIFVSPDGRFLYATNRGDDSVAVFSIGTDHQLTFVQRISTQGKTPRHATLSPDAKWLIAANQDTSTVVVYQRDANTGMLTVTANTIAVPHPMYILFAGV